jgi:hypothetical protein
MSTGKKWQDILIHKGGQGDGEMTVRICSLTKLIRDLTEEAKTHAALAGDRWAWPLDRLHTAAAAAGRKAPTLVLASLPSVGAPKDRAFGYCLARASEARSS